MSRVGLNTRFEENLEDTLSNRNMHGPFAIIPFILFLPFAAKLLLVTAATLFSAYEAVRSVR
jgi:hypothetical protein